MDIGRLLKPIPPVTPTTASQNPAQETHTAHAPRDMTPPPDDGPLPKRRRLNASEGHASGSTALLPSSSLASPPPRASSQLLGALRTHNVFVHQAQGQASPLQLSQADQEKIRKW